MKCHNLCTAAGSVEMCRRLGWDTICSSHGGDMGCAVVSGRVRKNARKALDGGADIIVADGRLEKDAREASETWEVDLIADPELNADRDPVNQWSGGLDHIMCSFMNERGIGYCVNADNILDAGGRDRVRVLGRITQNIRLCKKYKVKVVFACGTRSKWNVRSPHDLMEIAKLTGLSSSDARKTVSKNPQFFIDKAVKRNDPDVLLKGLEVVDWGSQKKKPNRRYGWY